MLTDRLLTQRGAAHRQKGCTHKHTDYTEREAERRESETTGIERETAQTTHTNRLQRERATTYETDDIHTQAAQRGSARGATHSQTEATLTGTETRERERLLAQIYCTHKEIDKRPRRPDMSMRRPLAALPVSRLRS